MLPMKTGPLPRTNSNSSGGVPPADSAPTIFSAVYTLNEDGRSWQGIGELPMMGTCPVSKRLAGAMRAAGGLAILQIYDGGRIARPDLIGEQALRGTFGRRLTCGPAQKRRGR